MSLVSQYCPFPVLSDKRPLLSVVIVTFLTTIDFINMNGKYQHCYKWQKMLKQFLSFIIDASQALFNGGSHHF